MPIKRRYVSIVIGEIIAEKTWLVLFTYRHVFRLEICFVLGEGKTSANWYNLRGGIFQ